MKAVKQWQLLQVDGNKIDIECDNKHLMHVFVLENDVIRVLLKNKKKLRLARTWSIANNDCDVAWEGRDRMSTEGFSLPTFNITESKDTLEITTSQLKLILSQPLWLEWSHKVEGEWVVFASERKTGAHMLGVSDNQINHFMSRDIDDQYFGLGEKAGNLNRHGRRFEMRNLDAMGYNAETTDPLYKHIPFYITRSQGVSYGLFYDNLATSWFDLGNELDNYHAYYSQYRAEDGDLDFYMIYGPQVIDVTKRYTNMTGGTIFGPKWSLGYSGSTMYYTDAENAQDQLKGFVDLCREHAIPCDSFQLSSGYTSIGDKRYVFNWNNEKVPNPEGMATHFHQAGMQLAANIKPCLLCDHPMYESVKSQGLFIRDSEKDKPEISVFWDADGSHLDFTNPETILWWKNNVTEQLLEKGIDSTWNDNNEFEIWDSAARCFGFGQEIPVKLIRPLQPLLMMRASFEAQKAYAPEVRPYLISRSGAPGMNRYVQTWTGDNRTNWNSLKFNIKMGLGMSLSGLYNIGHDVGGFAGDRPEPELFARWVQNGVMNPRFTIHSWNDDGTVNEPWMFPEVTPIVRDAMALRYKLMPYIYDILHKAYSQDEPMLRPTFLDHESDEHCFNESDDYLFGRDLLVASVVEEGQRQREIYLPKNESGWYDFYTKQWFAGGQTITVDAPLERLPLMVRAGAVIPMSDRIANVDSQKDDRRTLNIFPIQGKGRVDSIIFDDDGILQSFNSGIYCKLKVSMECDNHTVHITVERSGDWNPAYKMVEIVLPKNEQRKLVVNGAFVKSKYSLVI